MNLSAVKLTNLVMYNMRRGESENDSHAGTLKGAAPKGSADRSVLDITKSSRLFTLEIPGKSDLWLNAFAAAEAMTPERNINNDQTLGDCTTPA